MSDLIALEPGHHPWKPAPDAETVIEYQYYDVPLAGVLRLGGVEYYFTCLDGANENLSLWWYVQVTPEQRRWIEQAPTVDEVHERLRSAEFDGWSRLAFATMRGGILDFEDAPDDNQGMRRALNALISRVDVLRDEAHLRELSHL